ncbi:hypothetical protein BZG36_01411 [Bifiguratus adelaidae]|uniref:Uncharacterized protein n=1 Tax=Bifiguratus adelaidae TaxID=1938954 RepID=A0A261Y508_9FUNG|nr:hypothetical protein BZG36_01411 [Bifiguratus adelaidae]
MKYTAVLAIAIASVASVSAAPSPFYGAKGIETPNTGNKIQQFHDQVNSVAQDQEDFKEGGAHLGFGAAEAAEAAAVGYPQAALDIPAHVLGIPKPLGYDSQIKNGKIETPCDNGKC